MEHSLLIKALEASSCGRPYAFATIIRSTSAGTPRKTGAKMLVFADGQSWGSIGGGRNEKRAQEACLKAIRTNRPCTETYIFDDKPGNSICGGRIEVFIEPYSGGKHFIICGAGHIALPLSVLSKMMDFKTTIIDNRAEYANAKRFPHVDGIQVGPHARKLKQQEINQNTLIMIVTQGHESDYECLHVALAADAGYVGVIASQVKRVKFIRRLRQDGFSESKIKSVHAPAGLDIGAETPEEIALSIMSQIIAIKRDVYSKSLKFQYKTPSKKVIS